MRALLRLAAIASLGMGLAVNAARADQNLFLVDLASDPASLDPHVQWDPDSYAVYRNIFDNLVTRDQSGAIVPQVATAWHYTNDTTIVFDIRSDIKFQDGSPLTPDDVVFSVQRITNPAFKSPQLSQYDQITGAEVTGPSQVTLHTKSSYPVLLSQLTKLSIVPRAIVQKVGDIAFNQHPVGSGPYRFVSREMGVKIDLEAMPDYWRGKPPFPRVEMHAVPAESTRIADLRTGRADITRILSTDDADQLRNDPQLNVLWTPTERVTMLTLNALTGPTANPKVRAAISHAIDRNLIVDALLKGYAKPVPEPLTPASFGYAPDIAPYKFDPDQSRAIMKDAGIKPGTKLDFLTSPIFDQRVVQALQQMLADVGFDPEIRSVDAATYLRLRQGRPDEAGDVSYFRWSCGCQDADGTLFPLFHSSSQWAKYKNPSVDQALEGARNTLDAKARLADYHTALEAIDSDVAVVPLFQDVIMFAARKPVHFQPTANEAFFLMDISWH